ncbi:hypothetical protein IMG5_202070 [Ichthyophthirius multifiliis]|uniref:Uncharacterized protein n=1 Tax=Ichthyophthirius multifiliis TaxID=5932 RepID=G0R624_ICHMU|nr:hypothetical protein IMG5_202070 [Ichthyophthirius multifiliis]EGR27090.1 hypothetical protein IMG5_202070 [Ichthyophthirius multifiliis]|eukprot:XP_004023974.1 hypothetical protein IMG5_202070 [Ichthyophthirius multifiliis]
MTTTIEVEKLESLLLNMKIDETYQPINWENITKSQNETTKAFEALARQVFALKDNLSKSFVCSLKELKDYDLKDQIQKVTDKKINQQGLKNLSQYAIYEGEDLKINYPELNKVVNDKQNTLLDQNQKVQAKLFETAQWIEAFLRGFNVSKESNIQQQGQQEQKGDQQLQANFLMQSNKTFDFPQDKLNEVVSKIQVTYIPDTKKYISIQTYQQIVENSADIAEEEFTRLTFQNRTDRRNIMHQDKKNT